MPLYEGETEMATTRTPETDQNQDQLIGYLVGKVEDIEKKFDDHNTESKTFEKSMEDRMTRMEQKIAIFKIIVAAGKLLLGVVVAIISWKLGDVNKAVTTFWNALF